MKYCDCIIYLRYLNNIDDICCKNLLDKKSIKLADKKRKRMKNEDFEELENALNIISFYSEEFKDIK